MSEPPPRPALPGGGSRKTFSFANLFKRPPSFRSSAGQREKKPTVDASQDGGEQHDPGSINPPASSVAGSSPPRVRPMWSNRAAPAPVGSGDSMPSAPRPDDSSQESAGRAAQSTAPTPTPHDAGDGNSAVQAAAPPFVRPMWSNKAPPPPADTPADEAPLAAAATDAAASAAPPPPFVRPMWSNSAPPPPPPAAEAAADDAAPAPPQPPFVKPMWSNRPRADANATMLTGESAASASTQMSTGGSVASEASVGNSDAAASAAPTADATSSEPRGVTRRDSAPDAAGGKDGKRKVLQGTQFQYELGVVLGKGSYAKVKLCKTIESEETFAVKIFKVSLLKRRRMWDSEQGGFRTAFDDVLREIAIMKRLAHANVMSMHDVVDDASANKLYMVMDYCPRGAIMETESMPCAPLDAADARRWFADAVVGLEYLHFQGVVHYDLKPDNILVASDGRAVISDFGVSRVQPNRSDMCVGSPGTPTYTAPEVWSANSYQGRLADVWSLGVTLHAMVFGCLPYSAESQTVKLDLRQRISIASEMRPRVLRGLCTRARDSLVCVCARCLARGDACVGCSGADRLRDRSDRVALRARLRGCRTPRHPHGHDAKRPDAQAAA